MTSSSSGHANSVLRSLDVEAGSVKEVEDGGGGVPSDPLDVADMKNASVVTLRKWRADIGLAMDIQGTEVAKESSDIIILDDNFASVVKVVDGAALSMQNIQKFIQLQLTVNVAALAINVVAAVSSGEVPLNAVQLLRINLIMDTPGALALATEPPTDHLMHRTPAGRRDPLITNIVWRNLIVQAVYQVGILLVLNFKGRTTLGSSHGPGANAVDVKDTVIFNAFVLCQPEEFNIFGGVTTNNLFMAIVGITFVLQIIIMEFLGKFTPTVQLNWKVWLVSLGIASSAGPLLFSESSSLFRIPPWANTLPARSDDAMVETYPCRFNHLLPSWSETPPKQNKIRRERGTMLVNSVGT